MGWFTDYTLAPVIVTEEVSAESYLIMVTSATETPPRWKQKITSKKMQIRCLTYEAAVTCQTFYNAQTNTSAIIRRLDDTNQFGVEIAREIYEFTEETEE